ncbi:MAG: hypothetical protein HC795_03650 [Coleofasciculaceae cyanobacterium RL_1_1]|nr:hypothetical protein [Coleofasciculaceae cyanobacterium RL_1_1]
MIISQHQLQTRAKLNVNPDKTSSPETSTGFAHTSTSPLSDTPPPITPTD